MRRYLITILSLLSVGCVQAASVVPDTCRDSYCNAVRRLERGDTLLDYAAFRSSFIESAVFIAAKKQSAELQRLLNLGERLWHAGDPAQVIYTLKQALQIDYTSLAAHRRIRQAFAESGDTVSALRHKAIESGLLRSILSAGDGRSCAKAWPVIQVEEEYFILELLRAKLISQELVSKRGLCDRMVTQRDGRREVYYFELTRVFAAYDK